jgi:hypothetical protein
VSRKITSIEKSIFIKLFNRGGYVLNFSTSEFDQFTMESVGVPLCKSYGLSKGKSLESFISEGADENVIKLFTDLISFYELHFQKEIIEGGEYAYSFKKCKEILHILSNNESPLANSLEVLKIKFSSEYISTQIDLMQRMQHENPTEAIGKAKELIESCCKTILEERNIKYDITWDVPKLTYQTFDTLKITPRGIPDSVPEATTIKSILQTLQTLASKISELRNLYGSGHGKPASYEGLEERHAKLAVGSSVTLVNFLWDSHVRQKAE